MSLDQVEMAVGNVVADANPHAGPILAVGAHGNAAHESLFAECSIVIVQQQQARGCIAGNIEIGPAVLVHVECDGR